MWSVVVAGILLVSAVTDEPELSTFEKILDMIESYHFTPQIMADGRSHHFYHDDTQYEVITPKRAKNLVEFFNDFHFLPKEADDGRYHFWYKEKDLSHTPPEFVTIYRSDISNQPLEFGKFYHKLGYSYDINDKEYQLLSPEEKAKYVRIDSEGDLQHLGRDWGHQTAPPVPQVEVAPAKSAIPIVKYRSDISKVPLEFGKFYHKRGASFDLTDEEYNRLPEKDRADYVRIDSVEDLQKYSLDWSAHGADADPHAEHEIAAQTHVVRPQVHFTSPAHMLAMPAEKKDAADEPGRKFVVTRLVPNAKGQLEPVVLLQRHAALTQNVKEESKDRPDEITAPSETRVV